MASWMDNHFVNVGDKIKLLSFINSTSHRSLNVAGLLTKWLLKAKLNVHFSFDRGFTYMPSREFNKPTSKALRTDIFSSFFVSTISRKLSKIKSFAIAECNWNLAPELRSVINPFSSNSPRDSASLNVNGVAFILTVSFCIK